MFKKNYFKYFCLICIQLFFSQICLATKITAFEKLNISDGVPFIDENGNKRFLDEFEGKTILLVFWATWCAPCTKEMPDLDGLQKDFRKLPFEIIAVSQDFQGINIVKEYFKNHEFRYLKIYHDHQNQLFKAFSVVGLPTSFLIDKDGKIVYSFTGAINWYDEEVRKIILSHIDGNYPEPKNSYKAQDLNKIIKSSKSNEKAVSPIEKQEQKNDKVILEENNIKIKQEKIEPSKGEKNDKL